jgi:hypothetical protein
MNRFKTFSIEELKELANALNTARNENTIMYSCFNSLLDEIEIELERRKA